MPGSSANRKLCTSCPQDGRAEIRPPAFSPQLFPLGTIRLFNWFVIGEKKNREKNLAEKPPLAERYCTKLKCARKQFIIKELLVEATGVEPASENVTGQETTCLFTFMPWALPQDVRGPRSERTRNASR
jgi:hypothetical protein